VYCSGTHSEAADAAIDSTLVRAVPVEAVLPLANHCEDGQRPCTLGKGEGGGAAWLGCKCLLAYSGSWIVTAAVVPCNAQTTSACDARSAHAAMCCSKQ